MPAAIYAALELHSHAGFKDVNRVSPAVNHDFPLSLLMSPC